MEFIVDNLVWFIVGGVVILMTIIGYFAEKTDFGKNTDMKSKENKNNITKQPKEKPLKKNKKEKNMEQVIDNQQIAQTSIEQTPVANDQNLQVTPEVAEVPIAPLAPEAVVPEAMAPQVGTPVESDIVITPEVTVSEQSITPVPVMPTEAVSVPVPSVSVDAGVNNIENTNLTPPDLSSVMPVEEKLSPAAMTIDQDVPKMENIVPDSLPISNDVGNEGIDLPVQEANVVNVNDIYGSNTTPVVEEEKPIVITDENVVPLEQLQEIIKSDDNRNNENQLQIEVPPVNIEASSIAPVVPEVPVQNMDVVAPVQNAVEEDDIWKF